MQSSLGKRMRSSKLRGPAHHMGNLSSDIFLAAHIHGIVYFIVVTLDPDMTLFLICKMTSSCWWLKHWSFHPSVNYQDFITLASKPRLNIVSLKMYIFIYNTIWNNWQLYILNISKLRVRVPTWSKWVHYE